MPITRSPPVVPVRGPDAPVNLSSGLVASAISALPLDVGTAVSPTLVRPPPEDKLDNTVCPGGPGNATCGLKVRDGQSGTQCDICGSRYHTVCQGVSKAAYNALVKHDILAFICDACKRHPNLSIQAKPAICDASVQALPGEPHQQVANHSQQGDSQTLNKETDGALSQVLASVHSLEASIKEHSKLLAESRVHNGTRATYAEVLRDPPSGCTHGSEPNANPGLAAQTDSVNPRTRSYQPTRVASNQSPTSGDDYRHIVRAELREMEECRKRVSSLVVRGLRVSSAREAAAKFSEVVGTLIGEQVTLTEVCRIRSDSDLFRGNIHDNRVRKLILDSSKHLRDTQHSHVFIRRDLTFQQREELKARYPPRSHHQDQGSPRGTVAPVRQREANQPQRVSAPPRSESPRPYQETVPKRVWWQQATTQLHTHLIVRCRWWQQETTQLHTHLIVRCRW